jgi:ABC-2 type transport system ATP-binding protein
MRFMEVWKMADKALEITNLCASVGKFSLKNINLSIEKGTIMGLIGKNGAGKTTLIKTILEKYERTSGKVLFNGIPMYGNEEIVKAKIGVVYDSLIYPLAYNPNKIKNMISPFYKEFDHKKYEELMNRFELDPNKKLSNYSKGMQMKFGAVLALCHNPDLIILDEPTAGLDPIARAELIDILLEYMQKEEKSILFSTHITSDLEKIADYITMIDDGKILMSSVKDDLIDNYVLVHIDKDAITDKLKSQLIGMKETIFGYEGMICSKYNLESVQGIKAARPTIEDIMIYIGAKK